MCEGCMRACVLVPLRKSKAHLEQLALFLHYVGPRDPTQDFRLGGNCLYPLSHLASPLALFLFFF